MKRENISGIFLMPERNTAGIIKIIKDRKNNAAKIE